MDFIDKKLAFLKWIINNYKHQNPSVNFLLEYLISQQELIHLLKFSEEVKYAPRGLLISYQVKSPTPFIYYKDQASYTYCDQAFHDIRMNVNSLREYFYVEFEIPNIYAHLHRFEVFEENPYIPMDSQFEKLIDEGLQKLSQDVSMVILKNKLDQALDKHDYKQVDYYRCQIQKLKGE